MSKWKQIYLNECVELNMGQSPSSSTYNTLGNGIPFFQGNADFGEITPNVKYFCSEPIKIANKGDLLISVRAPIGALNFASEKCCIGRGLCSLSAKNCCNIKYLFYILQYKKSELNAKGTGSTFKAINKQSLSETKIPLPPLEEQHKIASILDTVSEALKLRKQQLNELDLLVKSRFVEMFGELGKNPYNFDYISLGSCCKINPKKSEDNRLVSNLKLSFISMSSVSERGYIDTSNIRNYDEVKTGFTYFAENDVLFAKITPCMENGKGCIACELINGIGFGSTEFHVLRPIPKKSNSYWLYWLTIFEKFRNDAKQNMTGSAGQRRVPVSFLEDYLVALPPLDLQDKFATFVQHVDELKSEVQKSINETQTLFDSLMQRYFE